MFIKTPITSIILEYITEIGRFTTFENILLAMVEKTGMSRGKLNLLVYQGLQRLKRTSQIVSYKDKQTKQVIYGLPEWMLPGEIIKREYLAREN